MRKVCKLEIKNDSVVKGVHFEGVKKIGNIADLIKKATYLGAEEIFLVDNTRSLFGLKPNFKMLLEAAKVSTLPITFGGGIKSLEDAMVAYSMGASRVYINTALAKNHELAMEIAYRCGRQSLSGGIEYRSDVNFANECFSECGREPLRISVKERTNREANYVGEFILTSITKDGTLTGPDIEVIKEVEVKNIPLIICGGINNNRDLNNIIQFSKNYKNLSGFASSTSYLIN